MPAEPLFKPKAKTGEAIYRHRLVTRLTHWVNVLALSLLLMSGLQIFNAHPRLYWGLYGADAVPPDPAFIEMKAVDTDTAKPRGVTKVGPWTFDTTGVLGLSATPDGLAERGFPTWITLPAGQNLALARRWHFMFAWIFVINGLVYLTYGLLSGHFRRDLALRKDEMTPRHVLTDIWDHIRLKKPVGEAAKRYNTLQKIAYILVLFPLLPMMLATGLTMSPGMDAAAPWLLTLFGGRQSARTIHFLTANAIILFVIVHVVEVLISGVWNELRSMVTGWYVARTEKPHV